LRRRDKTGNLRDQTGKGRVVFRRKVVPPPRVESTQPRETTPEPYTSGDETAGGVVEDEVGGVGGKEEGEGAVVVLDEDRDCVVDEIEGMRDDRRDWVDEDDEGYEDDDLLDLEYHPSFVSNLEKRRRRWETRWAALVEAVCLSFSRLFLVLVLTFFFVCGL